MTTMLFRIPFTRTESTTYFPWKTAVPFFKIARGGDADVQMWLGRFHLEIRWNTEAERIPA